MDGICRQRYPVAFNDHTLSLGPYSAQQWRSRFCRRPFRARGHSLCIFAAGYFSANRKSQFEAAGSHARCRPSARSVAKYLGSPMMTRMVNACRAVSRRLFCDSFSTNSRRYSGAAGAGDTARRPLRPCDSERRHSASQVPSILWFRPQCVPEVFPCGGVASFVWTAAIGASPIPRPLVRPLQEFDFHENAGRLAAPKLAGGANLDAADGSRDDLFAVAAAGGPHCRHRVRCSNAQKSPLKHRLMKLPGDYLP